MRLYHGSNIEITEIDFKKCRLYKDFGQGFYLTTIREQATKMGIRVARIYGGTPFVTEYDFDENALNNLTLNTRVFYKPNKEWALFVMNNRNRDFFNIEDVQCN